MKVPGGTVNLGHISACFTFGQMEHKKKWSRGDGGGVKPDAETTVPHSKMAAVGCHGGRKWDTSTDVNKR